MTVLSAFVLVPVTGTAEAVPTGGGAVTSVDVACPAGSGGCAGTATLQRGSRDSGLLPSHAAVTILGKQKFTVAAGKKKKLKLKLSKAAVKTLRKAGAKGLTVTAVVTLTKPSATKIVGKSYTLKLKAKTRR